jgi:8-hydroxy-5-deazaflavin:NADPH oxidoreductase
MRIAMVGAGSVGSALGFGWSAAGHDVVFAVRDLGSPSANEAVARGGQLCALSEAADAEAIVLAVPWGSIDSTLEALGDLTGKIVVDATNPVGPPFTGLDVAGDDSGGEIVQRRLQGARVVKAFNQTGWQNMAEAGSFPEWQRPVMFVAGDDAEACEAVRALADDLGFEGLSAGPLAMCRYLEPLGMLWISLANAQGLGREFAFSLIRR